MGDQQDQPSDLIRSVSRAFRVLEEVGASGSGLTAKQVARRCGLRLGTAYHLLRTLTYEGYLVRRPEGRYALGYKIASRFRDLVASMQEPPEVRSVLNHLSRVTGHSVYTARVEDEAIVITDVCEGPFSPRLEDLVVGFSEAPHATALGKALLSSLPARRRRELLRMHGMPRLAPLTVTEPEALEAELAAQRPAGIYSERCQFRDEVACLALLVRRPGSGLEAVGMSMGAPRFAAHHRLLAEELRLAARDLSAAQPTGRDAPGRSGLR